MQILGLLQTYVSSITIVATGKIRMILIPHVFSLRVEAIYVIPITGFRFLRVKKTLMNFSTFPLTC